MGDQRCDHLLLGENCRSSIVKMPSIIIHSIGKSILFGEHAVVYGHPAIAVPIRDLQTTVTIFPLLQEKQETILYDAPDLGISGSLNELPKDNVLAQAVRLFKNAYGINRIPSFRMRIKSQIPVASGLGSSASVSVGVVKALSQHLGLKLSPQKVNDFAFELEKIHHGNPSGIDNTIVSYEKAVYFIKEQAPEFIQSPHPLHLLLINSGIPSLTVQVVESVRQSRERDKERIDGYFNEIGALVKTAKSSFEQGNCIELGKLMLQNHQLLRELDISLPELDELVDLAQKNGAYGAKLCGAGRGGNVIALVKEKDAASLKQIFRSYGVQQIVHTVIQ